MASSSRPNSFRALEQLRRFWHLACAGQLLIALATPAWARTGAGGQAALVNPPNRPNATAATPYDLEADEKLGGHTIERHVGKTDRDLADRLRRESQISAASTYTDLATARRVVGAAVAQSRSRIQTWVARTGPRPNLVVNYTEPGGGSIGRSLRRGARVATTASRALVVIRWLERQRRWYVLTSYPEAR